MSPASLSRNVGLHGSSRPLQKAHLAVMDALMTLAAKENVGQVKMAAEAEQMGAGAPWENALLFWVNRVRRKRL